MAKDYRCLICQEDFQQEDLPGYCPYCLGPSSLIIPSEEALAPELAKELSFVTRQNLAEIIALENEAAELAHWAEEKALNLNRETFQKVGKSDTRHGDALRGLMHIKSPIPDLSKGFPFDYPGLKGRLIEKKRELYHLYLKSAQEALEPEIRELLLALLEGEERGTALLEQIF